jgi:hypothetical protein
MATTDARTGFRLPWTGDQQSEDDAADDRSSGAAATQAPHRAEAERMPTAATRAPSAGTGTPAARPAGKPSKFLADLGRAMQSAAEAARSESTARLEADAKAWIEEIHARSTDGATDLRRRADDDVAAIREWSKAETARIRAETDTRIADRKLRLESEIDEHAAHIRRRVEAVQGRVTQFQQEMADFFERLLAEDNPSRFASMAESLPEAPGFEDIDADVPTAAAAGVEPAGEPEPGAVVAAADATADPPDFAAAEAEALAGAAEDDIEVPALSDEELAARLASVAPVGDAPARSAYRTTQVVVTGLVSVASIAGFKRHLGRLAEVHSVAVSSGPDGEFIFTVTHDEAASLREAIPALPGFSATVTGGDDDVIEVVARDQQPES